MSIESELEKFHRERDAELLAGQVEAIMNGEKTDVSFASISESVEVITNRKEWIDTLSVAPRSNIIAWKRFNVSDLPEKDMVEIISKVIHGDRRSQFDFYDYIRIFSDLDMSADSLSKIYFELAKAGQDNHERHSHYLMIDESMAAHNISGEIRLKYWFKVTAKQIGEVDYQQLIPQTIQTYKDTFIQSAHMLLNIDDDACQRHVSPEAFVKFSLAQVEKGKKQDDPSQPPSSSDGYFYYLIRSFPVMTRIHNALSVDQKEQICSALLEGLGIDSKIDRLEAAKLFIDRCVSGKFQDSGNTYPFVFSFFGLSDNQKYEVMRYGLSHLEEEVLESSLCGKKLNEVQGKELSELYAKHSCLFSLGYCVRDFPNITADDRAILVRERCRSSEHDYFNKRQDLCPEPEVAWSALGETEEDRKAFVQQCHFSIEHGLFSCFGDRDLTPESFSTEQWFKIFTWLFEGSEKELSSYRLGLISHMLRLEFSAGQLSSLFDLALNSFSSESYMQIVKLICLSGLPEQYLQPTYNVFRNVIEATFDVHLGDSLSEGSTGQRLMFLCAEQEGTKGWKQALYTGELEANSQHQLLETKARQGKWLSATFMHSVGVLSPSYKAHYWQIYIKSQDEKLLDLDDEHLEHSLCQVVKTLGWDEIQEVMQGMPRYPFGEYERRELAEYCVSKGKSELYFKNIREINLTLAAEENLFAEFIFPSNEDMQEKSKKSLAEILRCLPQSLLGSSDKFRFAEGLAEMKKADVIFTRWNAPLLSLDVEHWTLEQFNRLTSLVASSLEPEVFFGSFCREELPQGSIEALTVENYTKALLNAIRVFSDFTQNFEQVQSEKELDDRGNPVDMTKNQLYQTPIFNPALKCVFEKLPKMPLLNRSELRELVIFQGEFRTVVASGAMDDLSFTLPQKIHAWSIASSLPELYVKELYDYAPAETEDFLQRFVTLPMYHQRKLIALLNMSDSKSRKIRTGDLLGYGKNGDVWNVCKKAGIDMEQWIEFGRTQERSFSVEIQTDEIYGRVSAPLENIMEDYEKAQESVRSLRMENRSTMKEIQVINPKNNKQGTLDQFTENLFLHRMRGQIGLFEEQKKELKSVQDMDQKKRSLVKNATGEITEHGDQEEDNQTQQQLKYELKALEKDQSKAANRIQSAARKANKVLTDVLETMLILLENSKGGRNELPSESLKQTIAFLEEIRGHGVTRSEKNGGLDLMNPKVSSEEEKTEQDFCVRLVKRDLVRNMFLGDKTACCIGVAGSGIRRGDLDIVDYLSDIGIQLLEVVDEDTGEPIYMSFLFIGVNQKTGEPTLVLDNIEGAALHAAFYRGQMREAIFSYSHELAASIGIKPKNVVLGCSNNDVDIKDLETIIDEDEPVQEGKDPKIIQFVKLGPECIDDHPKGRFYLEAVKSKVKQVPPTSMEWGKAV